MASQQQIRVHNDRIYGYEFKGQGMYTPWVSTQFSNGGDISNFLGIRVQSEIFRHPPKENLSIFSRGSSCSMIGVTGGWGTIPCHHRNPMRSKSR